MTVALILAAKGRDVVTIQPHRSLAEVAEVLVAKNIGAVVVADVQGRVIGILSERDIIRAVAKRGPEVFNDSVSTHMTVKVVTTNEEECVNEVLEKMTHGRFRHLPVTRQDRLVGLVSIGDVVKHRLAECEFEHRAMREYIAHA
jgi:CBS domain-containing protein